MVELVNYDKVDQNLVQDPVTTAPSYLGPHYTTRLLIKSDTLCG